MALGIRVRPDAAPVAYGDSFHRIRRQLVPKRFKKGLNLPSQTPFGDQVLDIRPGRFACFRLTSLRVPRIRTRGCEGDPRIELRIPAGRDQIFFCASVLAKELLRERFPDRNSIAYREFGAAGISLGSNREDQEVPGLHELQGRVIAALRTCQSNGRMFLGRLSACAEHEYRASQYD